MTDCHAPSDELRKAFLVGILLSASVERTEQALLSGIAVLSFDDNFREEILLWVIRNNVSAQSVAGGELTERETIRTYLPPMLENVLELPAPLRHCFVLYVLLGWPLVKCTNLLEINAGVVKERLIAAYIHLSKTVGGKCQAFAAC